LRADKQGCMSIYRIHRIVCGALRRLLPVLLLMPTPLLAVAPAGSLSTLARLLTVEDELTQWGFAGIALDELLIAYEVELEDSHRVRTRSAGRQRRLHHWQRATEGYVRMLYELRSRLDEGEAFEMFVDAQQQILIGIGDQLVLVAGPRSDLGKQIEARMVRQFCRQNDCQWLGLGGRGLGGTEPHSRSFSSAGRGQWSQRQRGRLRYEVDGRFVFEFDTVADRDHIAGRADQAADELQLLADEFMQVRRQMIPIEWQAIAEDLVGIRNHGNVVLNADSDYFELGLPILQRLSVAQWRRVVDWIKKGAMGILTFPRADSLF